MEDKLISILKTGRSIEPSRAFQERSRRALFAIPSPQRTSESFWHIIVRYTTAKNTRLGFALALATILVMMAINNGISRWNAAGNSANQELLLEAKNIEFKIQLESANYFADSADEVTALLGEIKKPPKGQSTDGLLNKVLF